jgi:sugar O-acyltransferase (sialic acid O-acetyltransferase NeuD family)
MKSNELKRLLIVGAGGFGREVLAWAEDLPKDGRGWQVGGFLDKDPDALARLGIDHPIVGDPDVYVPGPADIFVCAVGDPEVKLALAARLKSRGGSFATIIHPSAIVGQRSTVAEGSIICPRATITVDAKIGAHVAVNICSSVGHDAVLGDGCTLSAFCDVTGKARLGTGVFMGSHASILPGVSVGDFARIGAGSVVLRRVKPHTTVMGAPAKVVFERPG